MIFVHIGVITRLIMLAFLIGNAAHVIAQADTTFIIDSQQKLVQFAAIQENSDTIFGNVRIRGDVTDLAVLNSFRAITGFLFVEDCPFLSSLDGLSGLSEVGGILRIANLPNLETCRGLNRLRWLGGNLMVENNASLKDLRDLARLERIKGDLVFLENPLLENFKGLEQLTCIEGMLDLCHNIRLQNFVGLDNVTKIQQNCYIYHHDGLTDFKGLDNLVSIGGEFDVGSNSQLSTFDGLENLREIRECFYVFGNSMLTSIEQLASLESVGGTLTVIRNHYLNHCSVQGICDYLVNPPGSVSIWENGEACSTQDSFTEACRLTTEINNQEVKLVRVFPNPSGGRIYFDQRHHSENIIEVVNLQGRTIAASVRNEGHIDLSIKVPGIYLLRWRNNGVQFIAPVTIL